jgi:hypothetical protein
LLAYKSLWVSRLRLVSLPFTPTSLSDLLIYLPT